MNFYFSGGRFSLLNKLDTSNNPKEETYMLVEYAEDDYVFQIVCISGYKSGKICGYISHDPLATKKNVVGVTREHLIKEIKRNFLYQEDTLKLL
jgi:hypothetical protein